MQTKRKHSHRYHSWKKIAKVTGKITLALAAFGIQGIMKCPNAYAAAPSLPKTRKVRSGEQKIDPRFLSIQEHNRELASTPISSSPDCEAARQSVLRQCTQMFSHPEQQALCFRAELPSAETEAGCMAQNKKTIQSCHDASDGKLEFEALCVRAQLTPLRHASL